MKVTKANILLAEDDANLSAILTEYLNNHGYNVDVARDGKEGMQKFYSSHYDVCLLDVMMPLMTGIEMLQEIRSSSDIPVIITTARAAKEDILLGYELGCDDYVTKPYSTDILICRMEALLRRARRNANQDVEFDLGGLHFDSVRQTLNNQHISSRESELLLLFCREMNQIVERSKILKTLWQTDDYFAARSLSVYINRLRKLLRTSNVQLISIHGRGYKLVQN